MEIFHLCLSWQQVGEGGGKKANRTTVSLSHYHQGVRKVHWLSSTLLTVLKEQVFTFADPLCVFGEGKKIFQEEIDPFSSTLIAQRKTE